MFNLVEPLTRGYEPEAPFHIGEDAYPTHHIFRLLFGSADVFFTELEQTVRIRKNETRKHIGNASRARNICTYLFDEEVSLEEYSQFLNSSELRSNNHFFKGLRDELILCLVCRRQNRHTEAFLYFYRILEYISVGLPLIYIASTTQLTRAHEMLIAIKKDSDSGSLKVLEEFSKFLANDPRNSYGSVLFDLEFSILPPNQANKCVTELNKCVALAGFQKDGEPLSFEIPFDKVCSLLVSSRHSMFHYQMSRTSNLNFANTGGSENICRCLVNLALPWFSLLYAETIRAFYKKHL